MFYFDWHKYTTISYVNYVIYKARGGVVVKALRYKPAGHGFDGFIGIFQ